jgi:hypothetical protein
MDDGAVRAAADQDREANPGATLEQPALDEAPNFAFGDAGLHHAIRSMSRVGDADRITQHSISPGSLTERTVRIRSATGTGSTASGRRRAYAGTGPRRDARRRIQARMAGLAEQLAAAHGDGGRPAAVITWRRARPRAPRLTGRKRQDDNPLALDQQPVSRFAGLRVGGRPTGE